VGWFQQHAQRRLHQQLVDQIVYEPSTFVRPADLEHGWEYLYLSSELSRYLAALKPEADELRALPHRTTRAQYGHHFADISEAINTIGITVSLTEFLCSPDHLQRRLHPTRGRVMPADVALLAGEFAGVYRNLIHVAHDLKTTHYGQFTALADDVADTVLAPLAELEAFADQLATSVPAAVAQTRRGEVMTEPLRIQLTITMDDEVAHRLFDELARLKQNPPPQR
jgi:hypothetical protein